ncbi:hormone receptor domain protein, partial [Ancylostoma duodenale]
LTSSHSRPLTLTDDESFVIYRPQDISVPFTLSFEFRTSRTDTQVIVVEFEQRNTFYRVEVDDGLLRVWLGFAGDTCLPVCSLPGICASNGFCLTTNNTRSYDCQCQNGFVGVNCERSAALQACPQGYWGKFPHCKKCICPEGFETQCNKENGECNCPKFQFPLRGRCISCECGYGATSLQCSIDGQCQCSGQASGRRCDRCKLDRHVLDPKTLKCVPVRDHCPSQIEYGIQWPTTSKGMTARQSCPTTQSGLATRACDAEGRWQEVNPFNCTRPEYGVMVSKYDVLNSVELLAMLHNATRGPDAIVGRNLDIARTALDRVLDAEMRLDHLEQNHLKDTLFTESLALTAGKIAAHEPPHSYLDLVKKLAEYGRAVFNAHEQMPFLQPFQFASEHILFSIDALDFSNTLPKYNNFIDHRPEGFPRILVHVENATRAFYAILTQPSCAHCETPIVIVFANTNQPIRVEFELDETTGWRYPECVHLHDPHSSWSTRHAHLVAVNLSHAVCEFESGGVYTLFAKQDSGSYLRLSHSTTMVSPILAGVALLLCLISIVLTLARRGARAQLIRLGFITFCPMRNAILSFTSLAPFAWLFLYSLHLYRMLAEGRAKSSAMLCLLLGVVVPALCGSASFLVATQCSVAPQEFLFWMLIVPIGLMLLLSFYSSATSFLVSTNKQFDVVVVKFHLRRALCQHFLLHDCPHRFSMFPGTRLYASPVFLKQA